METTTATHQRFQHDGLGADFPRQTAPKKPKDNLDAAKAGLVYLATPYSHKYQAVRQQRFVGANWCAAFLMSKLGLTVFSPISHSHAIAESYDMPTDWQFWKKQDEAILHRCDSMIVFTQDGWMESVGVRAEMEMAYELNIPIAFLSPLDIIIAESSEIPAKSLN